MFFDDSELGAKVKKKKISAEVLTILKREMNCPEMMGDEELRRLPAGDVFIYDVESYPNYFCIAFKHLKSGKVVYFEDSPDACIDLNKLLFMLWHFCLVGFNSLNYDLPMVVLACNGHKAANLYKLTEQIINEDFRKKDITDFWKIEIPTKLNQIDLIEVAPLDASLKLYSGRLHCKRMQDLPYAVGTYLTKEQARDVLLYCVNDLDNTELLYRELYPQIKLREILGKSYGQDLRSRSDAQIAESVINSELEKKTGRKPKRPKGIEGAQFQYDVPGFVRFDSLALNSALAAIAGASFAVDGRGSPVWPSGLGVAEKSKSGKKVWVLKVQIAGKTYKLGMGGLHSVEKCAGHTADENTLLIDRDVASYYPRIILNQKLYPKHLGPAFLEVYDSLVNMRLQAKLAGNKLVADSLKITINGAFGKLGNKYSTIYAPDLLLQVTITGQLCLLMLIEMIANAGIPVISANTDGIVMKCPKDRYKELNAIIARWEKITQFETEETQYKGLYSRDVNNYIAIKLDGKCKTKGVYSEVGSALNSVLSKNPETLICSDAVQAYISKGVPVEKTISECTDIRRFVSVKKVKGGGHKDGVYLGKVVRWYYAQNVKGQIHYIESGNAVGKTEGASPIMDLPLCFPADMNFDWYFNAANEMLYDIGYFKKEQAAMLF